MDTFIDLLKWVAGPVVGFFFGEWNAKRKWDKDTDRKNIEHLMADLPKFNIIEMYYSENDLKNSFETKNYRQFDDAIGKVVSDPSRKFIDTELQECVEEIYQNSQDFLSFMAMNTFPVRQNEQSIKRLKYGHPIDDMESGDKMNNMTSEIFDKYVKFLARAREKRIAQ